MKKKLLSIILSFCFILSFSVSAFASEEEDIVYEGLSNDSGIMLLSNVLCVYPTWDEFKLMKDCLPNMYYSDSATYDLDMHLIWFSMSPDPYTSTGYAAIRCFSFASSNTSSFGHKPNNYFQNPK